MSSPSDPLKTSFAFSLELRRFLCADDAPKGAFAAALRQVITDSGTLFGIPAPLREVLEAEMRDLGLSQRDYVVWLLLERHGQLTRGPRGESPSRPPRARRGAATEDLLEEGAA